LLEAAVSLLYFFDTVQPLLQPLFQSDNRGLAEFSLGCKRLLHYLNLLDIQAVKASLFFSVSSYSLVLFEDP
jgi:hypothetical protein